MYEAPYPPQINMESRRGPWDRPSNSMLIWRSASTVTQFASGFEAGFQARYKYPDPPKCTPSFGVCCSHLCSVKGLEKKVDRPVNGSFKWALMRVQASFGLSSLL